MQDYDAAETSGFWRAVKRACGFVALLVGLAGVALAAAAVVQIWRTERRLHVELPQAVEHLESALASVRQQSYSLVSLVDATRQHVDAVRLPLDQLAQRTDEELTAASVLEALDREAARRLEETEEFARSMQTSLRNMSNALLLLDSMPMFARSLAPERHKPGQWKALSKTLLETADLLDRFSRTMVRVRSGQTVSQKQIVQLQETLGGIDRRLTAVQSEIGRFAETVEHTAAQVGLWKEEVPFWVRVAAATATVFFVCFGFSQLSLLAHGWHWLRS